MFNLRKLVFRAAIMFPHWFSPNVHPWSLTWNIIMEVWKIVFLSKWVICRFHVNLPGCMQIYSPQKSIHFRSHGNFLRLALQRQNQSVDQLFTALASEAKRGWFIHKNHPKLHTGRLTWNLQITHLERKMIFQTSMIMFHVNLWWCNRDLTISSWFMKETHWAPPGI